VVSIGEGWNQVAKHVGRRWETMQKQKCRRILGSGFPVENLVAVDGREIVMSHALFSLFVTAACTFFEMVLTFEKILYRLDLFWDDGSLGDKRGWNVNNDWRDGFLFVGNHLLLDFINTRPIMDGEPVELLPDSRALARWLDAAGLVNKRESARLIRLWPAPEFAAGVQELREFRERVREAVLKREQGEDVSPGVLKNLNGLLVNYPDLEQVAQVEAGFERRRRFAARVAGV